MPVDAAVIENIFRREFSRRDGLAATSAHASEKNEKVWWKSLVRDVFGEATELRNFDAFFDDLYDLFARAEAWKLYPEVLDVLRELKEKQLILGIISNWDSRLLSICQGMNLDRCFDFILASAVVGSAKPDPGIFREALRRSEVEPHEALHVGDSVENDFWGAQRAGIHALLVNRSGRVIENAATIPSLAEIADYIEGHFAHPEKRGL